MTFKTEEIFESYLDDIIEKEKNLKYHKRRPVGYYDIDYDYSDLDQNDYEYQQDLALDDAD